MASNQAIKNKSQWIFVGKKGIWRAAMKQCGGAIDEKIMRSLEEIKNLDQHMQAIVGAARLAGVRMSCLPPKKL